MSFSLNLVDTTDTYPESSTVGGVRAPYLDCPGAVKLYIDVSNNGVYIQMAGERGIGPDMTAGGSNWRPEVFLKPAQYSLLRNVDRIRFKSSAAGFPATITVEALAAGE